jgi:hypothetical protein
VQGARETSHAGGKGEIRIGQSGADEVRGVGADIAALVVRVDREVQPHQLDELGVRVAQHAAEVGRVVEALVDARHLAVLEDVAVDERGNNRQLGQQIIRICLLAVYYG